MGLALMLAIKLFAHADGGHAGGMSLAVTVRRVALGALVDRHADLGETREQMRALIEGHAIGVRGKEFAGSRAV